MRVAALCLLLVAVAACAPPPEVPPGAAGEPARPLALFSLWNSAERRRELRPIDLATGAEVAGQRPIVGAGPFAGPFAHAPDGRTLAAHEPRGDACEPAGVGSACRGGAGVLHLIDLPAWREVAAVPLSARGWVGAIAFSPDASRVALVANEQRVSTLVVVDATSGAVVAERALDAGFRPSLLAYRHDGAALVLYGQPRGDDSGMTEPGPPRVLLVDAATLELRWEQALPRVLSGHWCLESCLASHEQQLFASWTPAVVAAPDGRALYVVHADADRLTTVDLQARTVRTAEIAAAAPSLLERLLALLVSPAEAKSGSRGAIKAALVAHDGARLYVTGSTLGAEPDAGGGWRTTQASLALQVLDLPGGRLVGAAPIGGSGASPKALTPDGRYLLLGGWQPGGTWSEVRDARSLAIVSRLEGWDAVAARRLDGQPVVLASRSGQSSSELAVLEAPDFAIARSWSVGGPASWLGGP